MSVAAEAPAVDVLSELDFTVSLQCEVLQRRSKVVLARPENRAHLLRRGFAQCEADATWSLRKAECGCGNPGSFYVLCDPCLESLMEYGIVCQKCNRPATCAIDPL